MKWCRQDYADRLADLERERNTIELEKEQVERYKQLLMKQRDIMIALTQRLNERDDAVRQSASTVLRSKNNETLNT